MAAWKYMPILKWKMGERIALRNLTSSQWEGIVPLVELLPVDSKKGKFADVLPVYLDKVGTELGKSIPDDVPVGIDVRYFLPTYPK